jgi:hypothetical protein
MRIDGRAIVPYTTTGIPNSDKEKIEIALDKLEARTGSLKFIKRTDQKSYIKVFRGNGCFSYVGIQGGEQPLSLASGCMRTGTIQHEFMHALGFTHEQNRPDRNTYVTVLPENIVAGRERNFEIAFSSQTLGSPYDYNSIMHYGATDFGINGRTTIRTKNGQSIGNRNEATVNDIKKLKLLYQCENGQREWDSLEQSPCTSNCRCKNGEIGCGSDNNACQGSLVCSNNKCSVGAAPTPSPPSPPPPSSQKNLIYNKKKRDGLFYCIDLYGRDTRNGNKVWYYPCNFSPGKN